MTRQRRVAVVSPQTRVALARGRGGRLVAGVGSNPGTAAATPHLAPADLDRARRAHREQLRWALVAVVLLGGLLVGLPVVLAALPWLDAVRLFGIPVSWLAVAVLPYPLLVALSRWQLGRAEQVERE